VCPALCESHRVGLQALHLQRTPAERCLAKLQFRLQYTCSPADAVLLTPEPLPRPCRKPSLVEQYADYGSTVYAPLQRESRSPETWPGHRSVDTAKFQGHNLQEVQVGGNGRARPLYGRRTMMPVLELLLCTCCCAHAAVLLLPSVPQEALWSLYKPLPGAFCLSDAQPAQH
jgi:hypothetical protein